MGTHYFDYVREFVSGIREYKSVHNIPPAEQIVVIAVALSDKIAVIRQYETFIGRMTRSTLERVDDVPRAMFAAGSVSEPRPDILLSDGTVIEVKYFPAAVNKANECGKLRRELEELEHRLNSLSQRLRSEDFVSKAPVRVVESERKKEEEWTKRRGQLAEKVKALCGG